MNQISLQSGPKISLAFLSTCFGTTFWWPHLPQVFGTTVTSAASVRIFFLAFCHCEAYSFAFPLQNVDLDKHISPRRSQSNPPPFSMKWNPGLDRQICVRLQSSVEKWSQKNFCSSLSLSFAPTSNTASHDNHEKIR